MGLKGIHVVFITVCTLLSLSVAAWCWREYQHHHATGFLVGTGASLVGGIALAVYGSWFLKKMGRLP